MIVLESPHKDEYIDILTAPALGSSGTNLENYFGCTFLKLINKINQERKKEVNKGRFIIPNGTYHVILSNAIQYQCSLGEATSVYRDRIWLKLWLEKNFDELLVDRLGKYKPDIIINLCTKGSHENDRLAPLGAKTVINKKYLESICMNLDEIIKIKNITLNTTLRQLTQDVIRKHYHITDKPLFFIGNHPSSWFSKHNRKIEIAGVE